MYYINRFRLIQAVIGSAGDKLDRKDLLSSVDRKKVQKRLRLKYPAFAKVSRGFYITEESIEEENWSKMPDFEKKKISRLVEKLKNSSNVERIIRELEGYRKKYPDVPAILNYLSIAFERTNQEEKYYNTLVETNERFPDYIFGKISLGEYYLASEETGKIADLLDHKFEITQHYPSGTEAFHISAVRGFYYVTGRYFARTGKIELAYNSYFLLSDLDMDNVSTEILGQEIIAYELQGLDKKMRNR